MSAIKLLSHYRALRYERIFMAGLIFLIFYDVADVFFTSKSVPVDKIREEWQNVLLHLLRDIGISLIIAFVIAKFIEETARAQFEDIAAQRIKDIQENVFKSTLGESMPRRLIDEVTALVYKRDFIRTQQAGDFHLSLADSNSESPARSRKGVVVINVRSSSTNQNISGAMKDYPLNISIETLNLGKPEIKKIWLNEEELDNIANGLKETATHLEFHHVRPNVLPGESVRVNFEYKFYRRENDFYLWETFSPHIGTMDLIVRVPPELSIRAVSMHPNSVNVTTANVNEDSSKVYNWRLIGPILPHQGIAFGWWRNRT